MVKLIEMAEPGLHKQIVEMLVHNKHFMVPFPSDTQTSTVLDIAAGQGALSKRLHHLGFSVTASDINKENFKLYSGVEFIYLDLNKELELNRKFDSVLAIEIIEHLENPYKLVRDCHNLLNDNGMLIISTPNITNYKSRLSFLLFGRFNSFFPSDRVTSGHINPVPIWELNDILEHNGFEVETVCATKFHLNVKPKHSIKSLILKTIYTFGMVSLPFIQNWGFSECKHTNKGNVIIFKARKVRK